MPTIKMLRDFRVSPNGYDVEAWAKDEVKDVSDELAADLAHPTTLAAVILTGNDKADDAAEAEGEAALRAKAEADLAADIARAAAEKTVADAAKSEAKATTKGKG
jgi:hypothetical protein